MDLITGIIEVLKGVPDDLPLYVVLIIGFITFYYKRNDVSVDQVSNISKLQTEQLTQLIAQNSDLANELRQVRSELTEAYVMIREMRDRIAELEDTLKRKEMQDGTASSIHSEFAGI